MSITLLGKWDGRLSAQASLCEPFSECGHSVVGVSIEKGKLSLFKFAQFRRDDRSFRSRENHVPQSEFLRFRAS